MTYDENSRENSTNDIYLSLGSNLGNRKKHISNAIERLEEKLSSKILTSPYYESKAVGFKSDKIFLNICAKVKSNITPEKLLETIHKIEAELGRVRVENSGYTDRIIDIDILFYGKIILNKKNLKIPHPKIYERKFVLIPLQDIAKDLVDPMTNKDINALINACNDRSNLILYED